MKEDAGISKPPTLSILHTLISTLFDKLIWRTIGPKSFLFGPVVQLFFGADGAINTITNSINNGLLNGSKCLPMVHTLTIVEPIWSILQKLWSLPIVP